MKNFRLVLILVFGGSLTYLIYQTQFGSSITDRILLAGMMLLGAILLFWTVSKDISFYKQQRKIQSFALTSIYLLFIIATLIIQIRINNRFNTPTLLKVFYNGDYNGTGIDFKTDGTYIFDNSSIGFSDYYYGKYQINGNKITLDRDKVDNLTDLRNLELRNEKIDYQPEAKSELYLFQIDSNNNIIDGATEYKVVIDNRRK